MSLLLLQPKIIKVSPTIEFEGKFRVEKVTMLEFVWEFTFFAIV
jgi:hypothetical protein